MKPRLAALCALLCAVPAAAQPATGPSESGQSGGGQSAGDPYDQAVAARQRGDPAEAVRLLEPIVAANPANSDAQVQLGYARLALRRLDEAEQAFEAALAAAPDYADARLGLARVAQRRGDRQAARRVLAPLDPADPDVRTLRRQLDDGGGEAGWSLDLDAAYADVEGGQPDWKEASLQFRRRFDRGLAVTGRIEAARRFGRTDVYVEGGAEWAIGTRARAYLTLGGTPGADFRPEWQAGAGGSYRITDGGAATVITLDARHAQFPAGDVQTVSPGVDQYLFGGRAWISARWINLFDESGNHQSGYLVRGDVQPSDRLRLFAGHSDAPDTSEGVVIDTRSYFGGVSYDLSQRTTMRLSIAVEDRETGADRTQIGLGLGWRF